MDQKLIKENNINDDEDTRDWYITSGNDSHCREPPRGARGEWPWCHNEDSAKPKGGNAGGQLRGDLPDIHPEEQGAVGSASPSPPSTNITAGALLGRGSCFLRGGRV